MIPSTPQKLIATSASPHAVVGVLPSWVQAQLRPPKIAAFRNDSRTCSAAKGPSCRFLGVDYEPLRRSHLATDAERSGRGLSDCRIEPAIRLLPPALRIRP